MLHKWHVFRVALTLGVPLPQAILHDMSKFRPCEWFGYARYLVHWRKHHHQENCFDLYDRPEEIEFARNHHYKRNPHHYEYWVVHKPSQDPPLYALRIPERYVREMVADWIGAGRAQGYPDTRAWYAKHKDKLLLHPKTRLLVEHVLDEAHHKGLIK